MKIIPYIPYLIILIPLTIFLLQFFKKSKVGGLQFVATAVLTIVLLLYFFFQTGMIGNYVVKLGGKDFYIATNAFEHIIVKNLNQFAKAITLTYEKFYIREMFDISKESERVIYTVDEKGKFRVNLKLQYKPIWNTLRVEVNEGSLRFNPEDKVKGENNIYPLGFRDLSEKEAKEQIEQAKLCVEIIYLKDMSDNQKNLSEEEI